MSCCRARRRRASLAPGATVTNCPIIPTTGITLRRLVDDRGVLPPQVIEVIQPTPYPAASFITLP